MIVYIENPKQSSRNLVKNHCSYTKLTVYKNNIQKSVAFFYANIKQEDIKKSIPFTIAAK